MSPYTINPLNSGKFDYYKDPVEAIAHADLTDMPDSGGTNTDHDARYLKLDQTTPQTVDNGAPVFNLGITVGEVASLPSPAVAGGLVVFTTDKRLYFGLTT